MSRIFTKLFFAVVFLLGLFNTAFADKYKATMKFSGTATGESTNVDAEIEKGDDGKYSIKFVGFEVTIPLIGNKDDAACEITSLEGTEDNGVLSLNQSSDSKFTIVGEKLDITSFSASIGENGKGEGSFSGEKNAGFFNISADCDFTLTKVVDTDTIVEKELAFDNVPFYNKAIDMSSVNDTIKTNNDSSAVGIQLFKHKASFVISDYEIALSKLSLKQRLVLENLSYKVDANESVLISGTTNMYVKEYDTYVPAKADIVVAKDGSIDGTVEINVNMMIFNYQIIIVFGKQAEGVVVETKLLDYDFSNAEKYYVNSDNEFANDSVIYVSKEGVAIKNIHYSIVDQAMTFLIKEPLFPDHVSDSPLDTNLSIMKANKAEAYITVDGQEIYLKDVEIDLDLALINSSSEAFGSLTIKDALSATNEFIDPQGPFGDGAFISMIVDTTGNDLDGYSADTEFEVLDGGIYDYADGVIKTVKLKDLDSTRKQAIAMMGAKSFDTYVIATDKAGNSSEIKVSCIATPALVSIEEVLPEINEIRVAADSTTGKAIVKIDSIIVTYFAKNEATGQSKLVGTAPMQLFGSPSNISLPTTLEMEPGHYTKLLVWNNPITGAKNEMKIEFKVYETLSNLTGVSNVANKAVSVIYKDGVLNVTGVDDANVSVVSISGATVYNGKAGAINLHKGIYIVKVAGKAYKVVVK